MTFQAYPFKAKWALKTQYGVELTDNCRELENTIICSFASKSFQEELCVEHLITNKTGE